MREQNRPLLTISTLSPCSTRLTKQASIPAEPVPEMGNVTALRVLHTARSCSCRASITLMQSGSRCPRVGRLMASSTLAATGLGPGAIRSTWSSVPKTVVMPALAGPCRALAATADRERYHAWKCFGTVLWGACPALWNGVLFWVNSSTIRCVWVSRACGCRRGGTPEARRMAKPATCTF